MRFGCLGVLADMEPAAEMGFDYIEAAEGDLLLSAEEATFRRLREDVLAQPLFPEVVQLTHLTAPGGTDVLRRAALMGARVIVVDAGQVWAEAGGDWQRATDRLSAFGHEASRAGLMAALRADSRADGLEEAWMLVQEAGHPALGVAADAEALHLRSGEPEELLALERSLLHLYLPPVGEHRLAADFWDGLVAVLHELGYRHRLTVNRPWAALERWGREAVESARRRVGA